MSSLDWGNVTPEAADLTRNEFIYVYNHDLSSAEKVDRTIRFIVGRLIYYDAHLPKDPRHLIKIDMRGQNITDMTCDHIERSLKSKYERADFVSIEFIR
jgi:hypothetical protein